MLSQTERLLRNLDWNLLYTYLTIVEESSITGAARKLSLSQPSVSNALKRLESHLGVNLIKRKKGVFSLTHQGIQVYEYVSSASSIIGHLAQQFSIDEGTLQGEIDIQIASHIHCPAFDQTLAAFHYRHPKVLININSQPSAEIISTVSQGKLNIGLSNKKISQTGMRFDLLGYEQMAFYCSRHLSLFGRENLTLKDLSGLTYVSFESDQPGDGLNEIAALRAQQQSWGKLIAISSNEEEVRRLILAGVGFGALTFEGAKPFVEQGKLFQLPPYDNLPVNDVYLVTPENTSLSSAEQCFIEMLRDAVKNAMSATHFP
jgi:DNA-binding transcriptional LysR family regulator